MGPVPGSVMADPKFLTQSQYARLRGVSAGYVSHLKAAGRIIHNKDGLVDVARTDARIAATGRTALGAVPIENRNFTNDPPPDDQPLYLKTGRKGGAVADLRRQREEVKRQTKLVELGVLRGALLERADVDHVATDLGVTLRASLDAAVERLAPRLASASDARHIASLTRGELARERRRINRAIVRAARDLSTQKVDANE